MAKKKQKKRGSGKIAVFLALVLVAGALLYRGQQNGTLNIPQSGSSIVGMAGEWLGRLKAGEGFDGLMEKGGELVGTLREKGGDLIATIFKFRQSESAGEQTPPAEEVPSAGEEPVYTLDTLPDYSGSPYVELEGNVPAFTEAELTTTAYEVYSPLDLLGRCGETRACVGPELMPTEEQPHRHGEAQRLADRAVR